jgi:predicted HicB family RNase H-like nuclease
MPIDEKEQIVTSLKVNPELWKQAKIAALQCDITLGELIDKAIREWIQKQEKCKK